MSSCKTFIYCKQKLTGSNTEERWGESSPHIRDSLGEVVGECLLLKGGQGECDNMPDLGQVSKLMPHGFQTADLKWQEMCKMNVLVP